MKKRVAIPLAVLIGLIFWLVVFYNIGKSIDPKPQRTIEAQSVQSEPEIETPEEPQDIAAQGSGEEAQGPEPQVQNTPTQNPLLTANLSEAPVKNDLGQRRGTRAYITVSQKVLLEDVDFDDVAEFYKLFQGKGYSWVSIICPEGTGLVFPGARAIATYGELDNEGRMTENTHWSIIYDEDTGTFKEFNVQNRLTR